jgi:Ca-activated chloride channel family protein
MDFNQFHFSHPFWLWILLIAPIVCALFFLYYQRNESSHQLEKFIDKHLIPYLLVEEKYEKKRVWTHLFIWSLVWIFLTFALAGPRWNFREIPTFTEDQSLAILLDISDSMNAQDVIPSRLGKAKQKIEDLLNSSTTVKIGLIGFAADPHMIVPMTEDKKTILHLLPSLNTDLVYVQGSKLTPALDMAGRMLDNEPGNNKAIVIISDGGFEDPSAIHTAKNLGEKGIVVYTIGVGSLEGAPLKDQNGIIIKKNGSPIISKLEKEKFSEISKIGRGHYFDADHSKQIGLIFEDLKKHNSLREEAHKIQRFWEEHFYVFLIPVIPFFLFWCRRGFIFALLPFTLFSINAESSLSSFFYNREEQGTQAYQNNDYVAAGDLFEDPYRKGVAYYRKGDYLSAEKMFQQSTRKEVACSAAYNLGNAFAKQNKLQDAIAAYEDLLEKWPEHTQAQENLKLIKEMLEEQKEGQDQQQKEGQDQQQKEGQDQQQKEGQDQQKEEQSEDQMQKESSSTEKSAPRSQEDLDADLWLNQIKNDPSSFLKNKFYLESKKNGTKEEVNPW